MSLPAVQLEPPDPPEVRNARIPNHRATRWLAPSERLGPPPAVSVFVTQRAFVRVCAHAGSDLENEVGGWLAGKWRVDKKSGEQFIVVENILPAKHTRHGKAHLTFTQDTQVSLLSIFEERYPDRELVGWYHTHPGMGIFLSSYDIWLHQNFFPQLYQVALVIEPHSSTGGFFIRQADGGLDPHHYYGFYEILNRKQRNVVHWQNIFPETEVNQGD